MMGTPHRRRWDPMSDRRQRAEGLADDPEDADEAPEEDGPQQRDADRDSTDAGPFASLARSVSAFTCTRDDAEHPTGDTEDHGHAGEDFHDRTTPAGGGTFGERRELRVIGTTAS